MAEQEQKKGQITIIAKNIIGVSKGETLLEAKTIRNTAGGRFYQNGNKGGVNNGKNKDRQLSNTQKEIGMYLTFTGEAHDVTNWSGTTRQQGVGCLDVYAKFDNGNSELVEQFNAISGNGMNGLLPNGKYTASKPESGGYSDEKGFNFKMILDAKFTIHRTGLWIHPTVRTEIKSGGLIVEVQIHPTDGCIGLSGGHEEVVRFYNLMHSYFYDKGHSSIEVDVNIENNYNVLIQLENRASYKYREK